MNWSHLSVILSLFALCLTRSEQCSPPKGWSPLQPHKRAQKAGIVVYGTVISTPRRNRTSTEEARFYGVVLRVHCVVKGPKLPEIIQVKGFSNFSGGLCVHSKAFLNKSYVIFIKRDTDVPELFRVLEVNLQRGALHPGHRLSVLREVMSFVGENSSVPQGYITDSQKPGCPQFKRLREPVSKSKPHKPCRCRRKKQKRKKRKRIESTPYPKNRHRNHFKNLHDTPTLPRTRRYNAVTFDEDKVSSVNILPPDDVVSFSLNSHQSSSYCLWCLVTLQFVIISLLPT